MNTIGILYEMNFERMIPYMEFEQMTDHTNKRPASEKTKRPLEKQFFSIMCFYEINNKQYF